MKNKEITKFTIHNLPKELHAKLKSKAALSQKTINQIMLEMIKNYLS